VATTAERRERIRRAIAAARVEAIRRREGAAAAVQGVYGRLADQLADWLADRALEDGSVPPEALAAFEPVLDQLLAEHARRWGRELDQALAGVLDLTRPLRADPLAPNHVERTLRWLFDYTGSDGLQLSDRIWRVNRATKDTITRTIQNAIIRGDTARQAAQRLIAEGKAVPADVKVTIRNAAGQVISRHTREALMAGEGNPLRNALRVMRTEINRAFTESFVSSVFEQEDVAAVKFNLSPLHPRFDVCDLHARANLHGMGPGVYPQGKHPYPAHPETLSFLTVVFNDEITDEDRAGQQTPADWLRGQPAQQQDAILGKNKGALFRDGRLQESELFATWAQVRARIGE